MTLLVFFSCKKEVAAPITAFKTYDESSEITAQQDHNNPRMRFKLLQSKYKDLNKVFEPFQKELATFSEEEYAQLSPLIVEQSIPEIQQHIAAGTLNYEKLVLFYLYRIKKYESDSTKSLNAIISLNPKVLEEARMKDQEKKTNTSAMYGIPVLLKDNINYNTLPTTAGAVFLENNQTAEDAFIVTKLKESGALILGKVNLSEWAYFFCVDCPLGYSAIGGQTLNPYGRKRFETGGSSSGSGVAVAANYAAVAIGTETAGSITSPASQNSIVGLKPTIGVLSRTGIVPISNSLDTPGPMTKNVIDNAIVLSAMFGKDANDETTNITESVAQDYLNFVRDTQFLKDKNIGVLKSLSSDSIYKKTVEAIQNAGGRIVELAPEDMEYSGFLNLLTTEMKRDLPEYFKSYANTIFKDKAVKDIVAFNKIDSVKRAPYGQKLFEGIVKDTTSTEQLEHIQNQLESEGQKYLSALIDGEVEVMLSINNYHSAIAAVAKFPTLTVPMGFKETGEPISLTFIGKPFSEKTLLAIGYAFEQLTKARKAPVNYP